MNENQTAEPEPKCERCRIRERMPAFLVCEVCWEEARHHEQPLPPWLMGAA